MATQNDNTQKIIQDLEATRRAIWNVDALVSMILTIDETSSLGELQGGVLQTNIQNIRDSLAPTCETIDNAIIVLEGGKVPEPLEPAGRLSSDDNLEPPQVSTVDAGQRALIKLFEACDLLRTALCHSDGHNGPEELAARTLTSAALDRLESIGSVFDELVPQGGAA